MENPVVEQKPKKTGAIIGTIAAVLLCGCPGIFLCVFGVMAAMGSVPYSWYAGSQSGSGTLPAWWGYVGLCLSVIFILIPIVVGVLTLRTKKPKAPKEAATPPQEPLPPAS
jgi:hypothetical protein